MNPILIAVVIALAVTGALVFMLMLFHGLDDKSWMEQVVETRLEAAQADRQIRENSRLAFEAMVEHAQAYEARRQAEGR